MQMKVFSFKLPASLLKKVKAKAKGIDRSVGWVIRTLLEKWIGEG